MEFQAVYHKTSEQMSYALNENELAVNLKTGYDVERYTFIMVTRLRRGFSGEVRHGPGKGKRSVIRSV